MRGQKNINIYTVSANWQYFIILATCFGCKKPLSGQNRTMSRYNKGVHSVGSHIVHNCWCIKSHMLADIKRRKSQINTLKYIIQCVKYWRWSILYVSCTVMWWYNHAHYKTAGISQSHSMWSIIKFTRKHTLFKNSYSGVCMVYKILEPKLT